MNYIPNPQASGVRSHLTIWYIKISNQCRYIRQKLANKIKLTKINHKTNGIIVMLIALVMLLSMLFSISMIIVVGMLLFMLNMGRQSVTHLFCRRNRPTLS